MTSGPASAMAVPQETSKAEATRARLLAAAVSRSLMRSMMNT